MKLVIVTGLSGSGKSVALSTLEDLGYYCIDNLPMFLLEELTRNLLEKRLTAHRLIAVGIDARTEPESLCQLTSQIRKFREQGLTCEMVYLEAQPETLIKRFGETRRKHPLSGNGRSLSESLELERRLLEPLRAEANLHIDTTNTNIHELRELLRSRVSDNTKQEISLLFLSFGFKHGVPTDADFVFDMRCLPNPHWQPELRPLTGLTNEVAEFLDADPLPRKMRGDLIQLLESWIPRFEADDRNYLTVALGCTGGQHRSVYMAEQLYRHFHERGLRVVARHRELS